jgi:uncharacterized phage protein gp47/JayE
MDIPTTDEIFADIEAYVRLHHPLLTNFEPLSALSTLVDAISVQIYQMYTVIQSETEKINILTATGANLDALVVDRLPTGRQPGVQATGFLTFQRNSVALVPVIIPIGSIIHAVAGDGTVVRIQTTSVGTILTGTTMIVVTAQAIDAGTVGNIGGYSATYIPVAITGVDSVINVTPFTGGTDAETDSALRIRYQEINQEYGTATEPLISQHILDLEPVWEAHVYSLGYGDIQTIVDYDRTGTPAELAVHEGEIGTCLINNMAAGIVSRGAVAATITAGVPLTNIVQCEGGSIWVRPLQDITVADPISIDYIDKATATTHVATVVVPPLTLKGNAIAATMQAVGELATSVPTITYVGNKNYDILIGVGTYPYLFISPRIVPLIVTVTILTTETPSLTLEADIEASITAFLDTYMIGDHLQFSDLYAPIYRDHATGVAFVGIDSLESLVVTGNAQSISHNGETITIDDDQRIEPALISCILVPP